MTRSDEAEWWFNAVYEAVQQIPYGKVTSYGHIARLLGRGMPSRSRFNLKGRLMQIADQPSVRGMSNPGGAWQSLS